MSTLTNIDSPHQDFESIKKFDEHGIEYWEARELMPLLDYQEWRKFSGVIDKAQQACKQSKQAINDHFVGAAKMVSLGSGSQRKIEDYKLSRYACYLIAQNGDSRKSAIANAQTYFAIQTRRQEIFQQLNDNDKRLFLRSEVSKHNKQLFSTAKQAGVSNFGKFNNAGYQGLYGGLTINQIKQKKQIGHDDLLDRAGSVELAANLFRITQTDAKITNENIQGEPQATSTHYHVGKKVRQTIKQIGGTMPENLPAESHIKRLKKTSKQKLLNVQY